MEQWKEYRLEDFIHFNPTISLKKGTVAKKIAMDNLIPHSRKIYSWSIEPYSGGAKFQNGDTIMARITPCLENGKHSYVSILDEGEIAYGSTEYIVMRGINGISDSLFVYYLSQYPQFKNAAVKSMIGSSGRQRAQVDVLKNLAFNLPRLTEQKRIADFLSSLDDKIELNRQINDNLEQQAQALFKSWFVDFEPFKDGEFVDSELGMIPKGWKIGELGEVAEFKRGKTITQKDTVFGTIPVIAGGLEPAYYHNKANTSAPVVTISASGANAGYTQILFEDVWASDCSFIDSTCECILFAYCFLSINSRILRHAQVGAAQPHVYAKDVNAFALPIPNDTNIIKHFILQIEPIFEMMGNLRSEIKELAQLRDTLLPRLMSGELKINEINC